MLDVRADSGVSRRWQLPALATTPYAHLAASWVHAGQRVLRAEPLGAVGRTGRTPAPHLQYEARLGGEALDPDGVLTSR